jgi:UrcA family protein
MNRSFASIIAVVAVVASSQAVMAQPATGLQTTVSYADLNIGSPSGAAVLLERLRVAAHEVCGPAPVIGDLDQSAPYKACVKSALDGAVASVPSAALASLYGSASMQVAQN